MLITFSGEHAINSKVVPDFAEQIDIAELTEPVAVINHESPAVTKINKACDLFFELFAIMNDDVVGEDFSKVRTTGRVADSAGAAAD